MDLPSNAEAQTALSQSDEPCNNDGREQDNDNDEEDGEEDDEDDEDDEDSDSDNSTANASTAVHPALLVPSRGTSIQDLSTEILEMILRRCLPSTVGFPPVQDLYRPDNLGPEHPTPSRHHPKSVLTQRDVQLLPMSILRANRKLHDIGVALLHREAFFCLNLRCNQTQCADESCLWSDHGSHKIRNRKMECIGLCAPTTPTSSVLAARSVLRPPHPLAPGTHIPWPSFTRFRNLRVTMRAELFAEPRAVLVKTHNLIRLLELRQTHSRHPNITAHPATPIRHLAIHVRIDNDRITSLDDMSPHLERLTDLLAPLAGQLRQIPSVQITSGNAPGFNDFWEDILDSEDDLRRAGLREWIGGDVWFTRGCYAKLDGRNFACGDLVPEPTLLECVLARCEGVVRGSEGRWLVRYGGEEYWRRVWELDEDDENEW